MKRHGVLALISLLVLLFAPTAVQAQDVQPLPDPESVLGGRPGADGWLMDYEQLVDYLQKLSRASDRMTLREVGSSPLGKPMYVLFVSAPENLGRLEELREVNRRLALDPEIPDDERAGLIAQGRVFVMATLSMHSGEVGPSQMLPLLAHELAATEDPGLLEQLDEVVLMFVTCHNPDGMNMIVEWYRSQQGTPYEGAPMPGVYHRYVGHDNNRDFVSLSQSDTKVIARLYSTEWYPQVLVEKHQMGATGPRYFVPSNHDPIAENVDEGLWTWSAVFGAGLSRDMTEAGLQGVASHWLFDNYWPGSTETSHWKNVISFLTEAASCKLARPIFVEPTELRARGKGLSEYKKSVNMPAPWPGGWWRLADIVQYEIVSTKSILATAARRRAEILTFRNDLCRKEVEKGRSQSPYYFVLPPDQHDEAARVQLVRLLEEHGVQVAFLNDEVRLGGRVFDPGSVVVPLAQPYRAFVKEVLEHQVFPVRHYTPGGEIIRPYDVTSWSLPLHYGVEAVEVDERSTALESALSELPEAWGRQSTDLPAEAWGVALSAQENDSYRVLFQVLSEGGEVYRTNEPLRLGDDVLPTGSFLIRGGVDPEQTLARRPQVLQTRPEVKSRQLKLPRVALMETWFHDMDAGWTRFLFDTYGIPFEVLRPGEVGATDLAHAFDVVVFPDVGESVLSEGKRKWHGEYYPVDYPPEYRAALDEKAIEKLIEFLNGGGVIVAWGGSVPFLLDKLGAPKDPGDTPAPAITNLPATDISKKLSEKGLFVPGAFLSLTFLEGHPLTLGMPAEWGAFSRGRPVFETSIPSLDTDRRVIATYPEKDVLLSGYIEGEETIGGKAAAVWVRRGRGQLALFGFQPQFRASTPATYKLVFNALLLPHPAPAAGSTADP